MTSLSEIGPYRLHGDADVNTLLNFGRLAWRWSEDDLLIAEHYYRGLLSLDEAAALLSTTRYPYEGINRLLEIHHDAMLGIRDGNWTAAQYRIMEDHVNGRLSVEEAARLLVPDQFKRVSRAQLVAAGYGYMTECAPIGWFGIMVDLLHIATINSARDFLRSSHMLMMADDVDQILQEARAYYESLKPGVPKNHAPSSGYLVRWDKVVIAESFHIDHEMRIEYTSALTPEDLIAHVKRRYLQLERFDFAVEINGKDQPVHVLIPLGQEISLRYIGSIHTRHLSIIADRSA